MTSAFLQPGMAEAGSMAFADPIGLLAAGDRDAVVAEIARHTPAVAAARLGSHLPSIAAETSTTAGRRVNGSSRTRGTPVFGRINMSAPPFGALALSCVNSATWDQLTERGGSTGVGKGAARPTQKGPRIAVPRRHCAPCRPRGRSFRESGAEERGMRSPNPPRSCLQAEIEATLRKSLGIIIPLGDRALDGSCR